MEEDEVITDEEGTPVDPEDESDSPPVDEEEVPPVEDDGDRPDVDWSETGVEGDAHPQQTFTSQPTTPYYEGDIWKDGTTTYLCLTTRLTGSYDSTDWTPAVNPEPTPTVITRTVTYDEVITDYSAASLAAYEAAGAVAYAIYDDGTEQQFAWADVYDPSSPAVEAVSEAWAVASATNQYFWHRSTDPSSDGAGTGAFVTDDTQENFLAAAAQDFPDRSSSKPYMNQLINSQGTLLRSGKINLAQFTPSGTAYYDGLGNSASNVVASYGTQGAVVGYTNQPHVEINSSGVSLHTDRGVVLRTGQFGTSSEMGGVIFGSEDWYPSIYSSHDEDGGTTESLTILNPAYNFSKSGNITIQVDGAQPDGTSGRVSHSLDMNTRTKQLSLGSVTSSGSSSVLTSLRLSPYGLSLANAGKGFVGIDVEDLTGGGAADFRMSSKNLAVDADGTVINYDSASDSAAAYESHYSDIDSTETRDATVYKRLLVSRDANDVEGTVLQTSYLANGATVTGLLSNGAAGWRGFYVYNFLDGTSAINALSDSILLGNTAVDNGSYVQYRFRTKNYSGSFIRAYDNGTAYGHNMLIQSGGLLIMGGGEYPANRYALSDLQGQDLEQTYIGSDNQVYVETNGNAIANRKTFTFGNGGDLWMPPDGRVYVDSATIDISATSRTSRVTTSGLTIRDVSDNVIGNVYAEQLANGATGFLLSARRGSTYNAVCLRVTNNGAREVWVEAPEAWRKALGLSYAPGDSFTVPSTTGQISCAGMLTSGTTAVYFFIPLSKPIDATSCTISGNIAVRSPQGYIYPTTSATSSYNFPVNTSGITQSVRVAPNGIWVTLTTSGWVTNSSGTAAQANRNVTVALMSGFKVTFA